MKELHFYAPLSEVSLVPESYESPSVDEIKISTAAVLCQSGVIIDSEHDGFIEDPNDPNDIW